MYAPSTRDGRAALAALTTARRVLVVADREDRLSWLSLRNLTNVHLIAPDQLNTYDVLVNDWVVFTRTTLPTSQREVTTVNEVAS